MIRSATLMVITIGTTLVLGVAAAWLWVDASEAECAEQLKADEAKVRTGRHWADDHLPDVGDYVEIHWQLHAAGNPCSWAPGPTDWHYQGVLRLRPDDAAALAQDYRWQALSHSPEPEWDTPRQMWPALRPYVPAGVRWLQSRSYVDTHLSGSRWGALYLDPDTATAFFVLYDR